MAAWKETKERKISLYFCVIPTLYEAETELTVVYCANEKWNERKELWEWIIMNSFLSLSERQSCLYIWML